MSVISHFLRNKFTKCSCADIIHPAQGILFTHAADLEELVPVIILVFPYFAVEETNWGFKCESDGSRVSIHKPVDETKLLSVYIS